MTNRRQFIKRGGLWVTGAVAFPNVIVHANRVVNRTAGGTPAWTDSFAEGSIDGSEALGGNNYGRITKAYTLPAGTVSKLRFKITGYTVTASAKISLYSVSTTNLVISGEVSVTADGVYEVSVTPTAISSGDYRFGLIGDGGASDWAWGTLNGQSNAAFYHFVAYASFPPATIPSNDGNINEEWWVGAYITP